MATPSTFEVSWEKGLNEYVETTAVDEGFSVTLQNWYPEPTGGLRVPRGYVRGPTVGITGTRTVRGVAYFVPSTGARFVAAQAIGASQYKVVHIERAITGGAFANVETVTLSSAMSTRPMALAVGAGYILYATPEFPSKRIRRWDGTTASEAAPDAIAGRALAYHNNRFFSGGSTDHPTYLYWSELGDSTTWNVSTNFQPIGQDNGEPIEDIASWDAGLLIGKENSVDFFTGFGPDTFALHHLDGGGVAPGRTLVPTPGGVMAIGQHRVWWFGGGGFEPISQAIESTYGMTGTYMSGAYIDGCVYVNDSGSGTTWVYDLATHAWHTETFDSTAEGPGLIFAHDEVLIAGAKTATSNSLLQYRLMPGSTRAHIPNSAQTFTAKTGQMWLGGPFKQYTALHLHLQIRQRGGTSADTPLTVKHYADGALVQTDTIPLQASAGVFRARVDLMRTAYSHQFEFTQTVGSASSGIIDIEKVIVEGQAEGTR